MRHLPGVGWVGVGFGPSFPSSTVPMPAPTYVAATTKSTRMPAATPTAAPLRKTASAAAYEPASFMSFPPGAGSSPTLAPGAYTTPGSSGAGGGAYDPGGGDSGASTPSGDVAQDSGGGSAPAPYADPAQLVSPSATWGFPVWALLAGGAGAFAFGFRKIGLASLLVGAGLWYYRAKRS